MRKKFLTYLSIFLSVALLTNFVWESIHAVFLYRAINILSPERYVQLMLGVSLKDMLWLGAVYVGLGIYYRNFFWFLHMTRDKYIALLFVPLVIAILIEIQGVFVFEKWSYTRLMPKIGGLGLSPLLQLSLTMLFSVLLVKNIGNKS